jgi:hypothetical protein
MTFPLGPSADHEISDIGTSARATYYNLLMADGFDCNKRTRDTPDSHQLHKAGCRAFSPLPFLFLPSRSDRRVIQVAAKSTLSAVAESDRCIAQAKDLHLPCCVSTARGSIGKYGLKKEPRLTQVSWHPGTTSLPPSEASR